MNFVKGSIPQKLKLIHGFGAVAFGVKDSGFSFFLLLFYNQVLGMDAALVSLALLIALLVDAVVDPILGNLSDRTYTRWGRRLPWLYLAPIPLALAWIIMWSPPGGEAPSFAGLVSIAVVVRVLLSACEIPSVSLLPEITADYDERTTLFRYRYLFAWCGGIVMMLLAYTVFMPGPGGLLQKDGYIGFGICGGALIIVSVIGSALGQHKLVAHLPRHKPPPFDFKSAFSEIREAFSEKAFQERTGRRAEGSFYSGNWLVQKCATGFGIFITGQIISISQLSKDAEPGSVPQTVITDIIIYFGIGSGLLALAAAYWLGRFPIHRADHKARLAAMAAHTAMNK